MKKLENTLLTLDVVKNVKEEMAKAAKKENMDPADITNTELSCVSALLGDIAMSMAIIADHFLDKKGDLE